MDLNSYVVRGSDGSVDIDATLAKFGDEVAAFISETAEESANIANAVGAVFDKHLGQRITMPTLSAFVGLELNAQPTNMAVLGEKAAAYVRSNTAEYSITRGKNGGCGRIRDLSVESK